MNQKTNSSNENFQTVAARVSAVSIIGNLLLSAIKFLAGIIAGSDAMISDAVHSVSDVFSTVIVIIGVRLSGKASDKEHPYGHERMECVAAIILSAILLVTGLVIGYLACGKIFSGDYSHLAIPGRLALAAAVLSIVCKEAMFWYTQMNAKRIDSGALMADAWHHRSDSLSSIGALIGIAGARLGFPVLDPIASIVICIFIAKAAFDIFWDAIGKMVDQSCDDSTEAALLNCALSQEDVLGVDVLHTRMFGNKIYVDIEIRADGEKKLWETHEIAENVHRSIEQNFPKVKHIMVHVNPEQH
ncbi:MAG: cation transporter [Eubacterium sp.]|nr:cation transporter [Eubacterium sp.]